MRPHLSSLILAVLTGEPLSPEDRFWLVTFVLRALRAGVRQE